MDLYDFTSFLYPYKPLYTHLYCFVRENVVTLHRFYTYIVMAHTITAILATGASAVTVSDRWLMALLGCVFLMAVVGLAILLRRTLQAERLEKVLKKRKRKRKFGNINPDE